MSSSQNSIKSIFKKKLDYLLPDSDMPVIIALSGGSDSIALAKFCLDTIKDKSRLKAFHLNHKLRGDESDKDAKFVSDWCEKHSIDFVIREAEHLLDNMKMEDLSLEEAARNFRYGHLANYAQSISACGILTGHTRDDDIETFLMRMSTGASLNALAGIREWAVINETEVMRPILGFSRVELREYLQENNEKWIEDQSNFVADTLRNKIRLEILPFLNKSLDRDVAGSIHRTLDNLKRESSLLDALLKERQDSEVWIPFFTPWKKGLLASAEKLRDTHIALFNRTLLHALDDCDLPIKKRKADIFNMAYEFVNANGAKKSHHIGDNIYIARAGKAFCVAKVNDFGDHLPFDIMPRKDEPLIRKYVSMIKNHKVTTIKEPGTYNLGEVIVIVEAINKTKNTDDVSHKDVNISECFDASLLDGGIELVYGATITSASQSNEQDDTTSEAYRKAGNKTLVDQWLKWPVLKKDKDVIWILGVCRRKTYFPSGDEKVIKISAKLPDDINVFI